MIKVFDGTDNTFSSNGDVVLNPTRAIVHKEDNGSFYLDLETNLNEETKIIEAEEGSTITIDGSGQIQNVDTTKEVELTQVLGNTTQDGTPTPSNPQEVKVVTGRQEVEVCGKNRFNIGKVPTSTINITGTNQEFTISQLGSNTNTQLDIIFESGKRYAISGAYASTKANGSLRITYMDNTTENVFGVFDNSIISKTNFSYVNNSKSIKSAEFRLFSGGNYMIYDLQIEEIPNTSTIPTSYEPYQGKSYEINLGKQLFNYDDTHYFRFDNASTLSKTNNVITFTNSLDNNRGFVWWNIPVGIGKQLSISYSSITEQTENSVNGVCYLESDTPITSYVADINNSTQLDKTSKKATITTTKQYVVLILRARNINTISISDLQVEYGTPTTYAEYFTPIELCKIGTYQDKIYKDNGKWYLYKTIGKVVLNGSESGWALYNASGSQPRRFGNNNNMWYANSIPLISNYFIGDLVASQIDLSIWTQTNYLGITDKNSNWASASDLKTWLSTHNTSVYYVLNTPTTTEITSSNYPELYSQLNEFELVSGLNNITITSNNLPAIIDIHYNYVTGGEVKTSYIDYLVANNILVANTPQGNQAFRITNVDKTRSKIRLQANHIFYDSSNYVIKDSYVVEKNCNDALDHLNNATDNESPFTTTSNINTINSYRCVRKSLYEAIQVVLERWGGHLVRDNFEIKIMDTIGSDNQVVVRYGKNLKNIEASYDWNAVATKLMPVGNDGLLLPEEWLYSNISYEIPYTKVVSFDQSNIVQEDYEDETAYQQALIDDLRQKGNDYLATNSVPMVNYTLDANLERISDVGDTIEVIDERLGINLMTHLISFEYNCLLDKYEQLQFGNFTPKLNDLMTTIADATNQAIEENNAVIRVTLSNELEQATDKIWDALGSSYIIYDGDKILVLDQLPKEEAQNVIMINSGGIGFSNTGIDGTFTSAWTIDNVLNMENINVINLTADLIKGGILKLGSNLNQYGQIEIYNEANDLISEMNKDGFKMYGQDGSYILINNQVGLSGYDRNGDRIYWADGNAFHMKKSEVEEEITLCGKMRYIPIQITSNGTITNDGIGLVSVLGGE